MALLDVEDLDAGYGDLEIISDIDFDIADDEFVTIIGPNGAGKTTLMDSIFGLTTHHGGTITYAGEDITSLDTEQRIRKGMNYAPQDASVFPNLTVMENLKLGAYTRSSLDQQRLDEIYARFPILEERHGQIASTLSGGQQKMLAVARAIVTEPDLLLLDEPSSGLAPNLVLELFDKITEINDSGTAVLVVEQNAEEMLERADRGYLLAQGRIELEDDADAMLESQDIREKFLGG